jgi:two-component system nitrate/nitrite response regulator NarL
MTKYSLILASDNRLFRATLSLGLESDFLTVAAAVNFTSELTPLLMTIGQQPDLIIVDSPLDLDHEITVLTEISRKFPQIGIVVLVDQADDAHMGRVLTAGVRGFLPKNISLATLHLSLQLIALGENLFTTPAQLSGARRAPAEAPAASLDRGKLPVLLSEREVEILDCLGAGSSNKVIARELGVAEATVKVHIKSVLRKINVKNRTQAAVWAMSNRPSAQKALTHRRLPLYTESLD